jgi:hypothetical protein
MPWIRRSNFFAVAASTFSGSSPFIFSNIRWVYSRGVSFMIVFARKVLPRQRRAIPLSLSQPLLCAAS